MGKRSVISITSIGLMLLVLFGAFQNCAGPDVTTGEDPSLEAQNRRNSAAPFAFDVTVNRFAYMSCVNGPETNANQNLARPTFFTFKVSAADNIGSPGNAGVRLSEEFLEFADEELPKRTDENGNRSILRDDLAALVNGSRRNAGARLQLSVRPIVLPATHMQQSAEEGQDFTNIYTELSDGTILDQIIQLGEGERLNYIDGGSGTIGRKFEGSIGFFDSEQVQDEIRADMANRNDSMVMLTFEEPGAEDGQQASGPSFGARSPYDFNDTDDEDTAFGIGLLPKFSMADPRNPTNPLRVLRELKEYNLTESPVDRSNKAEWICDPNLRYKIFSPLDAENPTSPENCARVNDPVDSTNPQVLAEIEMLRSILPHQSWFINIPGKCIVPKQGQGDCYPKDIDVQYRTDQECGPGTEYDCAHYLSICYRTQNI